MIDNHDIGNGFFEYVRATLNGPLDCKRITYKSTLCLLVFCAFVKSNDGSIGTLAKQVQRSLFDNKRSDPLGDFP